MIWSIVGFGIVVRLVQFFSHRSLWVDEAMLALNIVNKSYSELWHTLDYLQIAPLAFLTVEKFSVQMFGNSEYSLRLFPLLAGIASIFLFLKLARLILDNKAVPAALALFVASEFLIYYSSEVKQYSCDVAITLLLLLSAVKLVSSKWSFLNLTLFSLAGALLIWFSHPSVFVLAGIGVHLTGKYLIKKKWSQIGILICVFSLWSVSFAVNYSFVCNNENVETQRKLLVWEDSFMPLPPGSISDIFWYYKAFKNAFSDPARLGSSVMVVIVAFVVGFYSFLVKKKDVFWALVLPVIFAMSASGLHLFPFKGRVLLFIVPMMILGIGEGIEIVRQKLWLNAPLAGICFVLLIVFFPIVTAGKLIFKPITRDEIKPMMSYLKDHRHKEDVIYVYRGAIPAYQYYARRYGLDQVDYIQGTNSVELRNNRKIYKYYNLADQIDTLRGQKRVWFLFTNVRKDNNFNEERFYIYYLEREGKRLDSYVSETASIYLYDLHGQDGAGTLGRGF
ncbi:MAG: hypothetical protein AMJ79_01490 [Phycisphaerae bacterium SM23_30]|nr:MAG: hypothetical protein AMJ79_01490 [Phycisphaerae bacterium SM23_30]